MMIKFLFAYVVLGSIFKWLLDFHVPARHSFGRDKTMGEEMRNDPFFYGVLLSIWPVSVVTFTFVFWIPDGYRKLRSNVDVPWFDKRLTEYYEDFFQSIT